MALLTVQGQAVEVCMHVILTIVIEYNEVDQRSGHLIEDAE